MVHGGHPPLRIAFEMSGFGRHFKFHLSAGAAFATLAVAGLSLLSILATFLFISFGTPILARLFHADAQMRARYEDRIATLRYSIDHLASRQGLDRDTLEGTVQDLAHRQARLEMRHALLANLVGSAPAMVSSASDSNAKLSDPKTTGSTTGSASTAVPVKNAPTQPVAPRKAPDAPDLRTSRDSLMPSHTPGPLDGQGFQKRVEKMRDLDLKIARLESSVDTTLTRFTINAVSEAERLSSVLVDLPSGIAGRPSKPVAALASPKAPSGMGGPLISGTSGFEEKLAFARRTSTEAEKLRGFVARLPLSRPLAGDPEVSSGFGYRSDPFTRQAALHSGLDLRYEPGAPALATAPGIVTNAEYSGAYGNMVEIDHGNGVSTRYGHLARILVREGMTVERGMPVGTVGSTGRSTGPHLHYETRISDEAVDPLKFLRAGERLRRM